MRKFLILISSTGAGHKIAGISIKDILEDLRDERPLIVDILKISKFPYSISDKIYYFLADYPSLWKSFFYITNNESYEKFLRFQNFFLRDAIRSIIKEVRPKIIFSTHPFYVPILYELKCKYRFEIISVITDFGEIHRAWTVEGYDLLWLPSEYSKIEIEKKGLIKGNFEVLGYPVRRGFRKISSFSNDYILVMGGGRGAGPIFQIFKKLKNLNFKQIYVCGTNIKIKKRLLEIGEKEKLHQIEVIGYTEKIYELISRAIAIISKPGGSTVAECNYLLKPFVAIDPLPGQEMGNTKFLETTGSGILLDKLENINDIVEDIVNGKIKFEFKERIRDYEEKQKKFIKSL
ncbi:MAG: glycosyltransferase [Candidatus Hydrothermales bacterium]